MLAPGARLGRYEVISPLGAGGMGEVYRARDTELDREVAIKVLPAGALADETARKRFRKEAHALSRLAHPHLATLHDFSSADGIDFLVMELLEGETLADRLKKGALPLDQVLRYGIEIGEALDAAQNQPFLRKNHTSPAETAAIRARAMKYPYRQCSSGMWSKFIP